MDVTRIGKQDSLVKTTSDLVIICYSVYSCSVSLLDGIEEK